MGIIKLDDVIAWQRNDGWTICDDCAPEDTDQLTPITVEEYDPDDYAITCDNCHKRLQ